jgi:hypothetical protein
MTSVMNEYGVGILVERLSQGKIEVPGERPMTVQLFPSQTQHEFG